MKFQIVALTAVIAILMFSCNSPRKEAEKVVREWMGKEVKVPDGITFKIMGRDTICSDLWNKSRKILVYVDSIGCTSCRLGLSQWKEKIDTCRSVYPDVGFLFVIHSDNYKKFEREVRFSELDYPIIYDYRDEFHKLNKFPPDPYRTFLLDKNNKVLLIGSPIHNPKIWELFKKTF